LAVGAILASYRLIAYRADVGEPAARLIGLASRVSVLLLLSETLLLPIVLSTGAGVGRRLLAFTLSILAAHVTLRWEAVQLIALATSAFALAGDVAARALIVLGVPGIAINGPDVMTKLNRGRPGSAFEWTGQPGFPIEFHATGRWNRWGFNDREPPDDKTDAVVVVVGDSYVEGLQVPQSDVLFRVAEARLQRAGNAVRMVGLGESLSGACAAADRLERFGELLQPTVVVYAFAYNDVRDDYGPWARDAVDIESQLPAVLSMHFVTHVPSLDLRRFYGRTRARAWLAAHRSRQNVNPDSLILSADGVGDVSAAWETTLSCVDRMDEWARTHGSTLATLELPPGTPLYYYHVCIDLHSRGLSCDPEAPRRRLAERARQRGYPFWTPIEHFRKAWAAGERLRFTWDGHFNSAGHRLIGEFLSVKLPSLMADRRAAEPTRQ
jgi:lysophospholipase L1-like esterase